MGLLLAEIFTVGIDVLGQRLKPQGAQAGFTRAPRTTNFHVREGNYEA